jgi:hypothetical protein
MLDKRAADDRHQMASRYNKAVSRFLVFIPEILI